MSYDDWKCTDPSEGQDDGEERREDIEEAEQLEELARAIEDEIDDTALRKCRDRQVAALLNQAAEAQEKAVKYCLESAALLRAKWR